ncbi:HNH endonuclease family protein [Streptomyces uncialis]|uniref:HNH endonuclease family protein n=1 Tax=Streptomyces uncialis TaxID=1048205 RepID=UPI0037B28CF4
MSFHLRRPAVLASVLVAALTVTAAPAQAHTPNSVAAAPRSMPEPVGAATARAHLAQLTVAAEDDTPGYTRSKFPHWSTQSGTCDTRETVLERDGTEVVRNDACAAVSGTWYSEYDGATWTAASDIDIDHMVPLKEAWRSGAGAWTNDRRKAFANDLTRPQLIAVTDNINQGKGDKDPGKWLPPLPSYLCTYARAWVHVKHTYGLTVDTAEHTALRQALKDC